MADRRDRGGQRAQSSPPLPGNPARSPFVEKAPNRGRKILLWSLLAAFVVGTIIAIILIFLIGPGTDDSSLNVASGNLCVPSSSTGKVGVGTCNPMVALDVQGASLCAFVSLLYKTVELPPS